MRAFAHDIFSYPLPAGHRFPLGKYRLVREGAEAAGIDVRETRAATRDELALGHDEAYIDRVDAGGLSRREELALGLPWSRELVERSRRSVGRDDPRGGGRARGRRRRERRRRHAPCLRGFGGRGFCVFNDVVVAARALRRAGFVRRVLVVDLDVHQGDGTHAAFLDDAESSRSRSTAFGTTRFAACRATSSSTSPTAPVTSATSAASRGSCRRRSRGPGRTSASTSAGPIRTRATGWAGSALTPRRARRARCARARRAPRGRRPRLRDPRRRLRGADRRHRRHQPGHPPPIRVAVVTGGVERDRRGDCAPARGRRLAVRRRRPRRASG